MTRNKVYRIRLKGTDKYLGKGSYANFGKNAEYAFAGEHRARQKIKDLIDRKKYSSYVPELSDIELVTYEETGTIPIKLFDAPDHIKVWNEEMNK